MHNNKNNHPEEPFFHSYLDNELPQSIKIEFEEHINQCVECAEEINLLKKLFLRIEGLPEFKLSTNISQEIVQTLQNENRIEPILKRITWLQIVFGSFLMIILVLLTPNNILNEKLVKVTNLVTSSLKWIMFSAKNIPKDIIPELSITRMFNFSFWKFSPTNLPPMNIYIPLAFCTSLLWLIGNKILLPNKSQNGG